MQLDELLQDIARGAGAILKERYGAANAWRTKSDRGDIVTEVDEQSERYIIQRITAEFPQDHIVSEESGISGGEGERTWIIDPIDGTRNYAIGVPFFCVSIGVAVGGVAEAGVVYDPLHDEMFVAQHGQGALLNGEPMRVSADSTLEDALVAVSWVRLKVDGRRYIRLMDEVSEETSYFRRMGSAALMLSYVACGRLHCFVQGGLNPWDVAASVALIEGAGGIVTDFEGRPIDLRRKSIEILAANPRIHGILLNKIRHGASL